MTGKPIVVASWLGTLLVVAVTGLHALGVDGLEVPAMVVALGVFFVSLPLWGWVFLVAAARSSAGENVAVANLFLFDASVPVAVRAHLFSSLGVCTAVALAVATRDPFAVLTPMWPLGLCGLWGARHGTYGPRTDVRH